LRVSPSRDHDVEIAAALARRGQSAVGVGRFVHQAEVVAPGGLAQQRCRALRADLLVRIQQHLPSDAFAKRTMLERIQRQPHRQQSTLEVGDAGTIEAIVVQCSRALEWMIGAEHGVEVATEKHAQRCVGALADAQRASETPLAPLSAIIGGAIGGDVEPFARSAKRGEARRQTSGHGIDAVGVEAAGVDVGQVDQLVSQRGNRGIDGAQGVRDHRCRWR
jgi:hypothetical protein